MPIAPRPVRSQLFVPGDREDRLAKARASGADAVIADLEGAVTAAAKGRARDIVGRELDRAATGGCPLFVRVGSTTSGQMVNDLAAVVRPGLAGVLLPQVVGADDVRLLETHLDRLERERGLPEGSIIVQPLLETPQSIRDAYELACCSPRIAYMGAGISRQGDIARRMGFRWTAEGLETLFIRSKVLLDVRAAGIAYPLSGIWGEIADLEGLRAFAEQTLSLGYTGMMVIHPTHVAPVNEVFTPSADDIAQWREILAAMAAAEAEGVGAIRLRGRVIDEAHVHTARHGLALAEALAGPMRERAHRGAPRPPRERSTPP
jgi:citrate lyase subunit beta/citryl-CoA lyase